MDYSGFIIPLLAFVDGLLFGLAIKKGIVSFVLLLVAFVVSSYLGFTVISNHTITTAFNFITTFVSSHIQSVTSLIPIGSAGAISLVAVLFIIGLGIGIWKG
jgi:accessory gene regulator protein AgrB